MTRFLEINVQVKQLTVSSSKCCTYCQTTFSEQQEQRAHYKLDWHRYNLKQALLGRATISADDFAKLSDDVSSISGSESDDSEGDEPKRGSENRLQAFRDARIFWTNDTGETFSIYKCLLLGRKESKSAEMLHTDLVKFLDMPKKWMIIMLGQFWKFSRYRFWWNFVVCRWWAFCSCHFWSRGAESA